MKLPRPTLKTVRTIVRLPTHKDVVSIVRYLQENAAHLAPFDPTWPLDFCTAAYWERRVLRSYDEFDAGTAARFFIFDRANVVIDSCLRLPDAPTVDVPSSEQGSLTITSMPARVLGTASLTQITRGPFHACYLGYALAADAQGKGLMFEALTRILRYAFDDMHLHRIMANYMPRNERSGRLLRRLGFVVEGYARDYLRIAGQWEDHVLTSLTNAKWQEPPAP